LLIEGEKVEGSNVDSKNTGARSCSCPGKEIVERSEQEGD
jgi:hypothetical protein